MEKRISSGVVENINNYIEGELPMIKKSIEVIIEDGFSGEDSIKFLLNKLVNFAYWKKGEDLFETLNNYYFRINRRESLEYFSKYKDELDLRAEKIYN